MLDTPVSARYILSKNSLVFFYKRYRVPSPMGTQHGLFEEGGTLKKLTFGLRAFLCTLPLFALAANAGAVYIDENRTLEFTGKAQSRVSIRLQDSEGFTAPSNISEGNLVQWRNIAYMEINHDLERLQSQLDILKPLEWLKLRAKYHLVARFMYEAIYNVGPQGFKDARENDKENIDSFKQQYDLWEFYFDLSRGPMFFRLGKQNLAWGETDVFRLLDQINPLDNTFGGPFEDLDDRRIPLWMLRGSYNLGVVGPIDSLTIEGFWVPGNWDVKISPLSPYGTAYSAPLPLLPPPLRQRIIYPSKTMSNSRWGVRLMAMLWGMNLSVAHYKTFMDLPTPLFVIEPNPPPLGSPFQELRFDDVQITGGSFNYWESMTDTVFRGEVAWFWNEAVLIPDINIPIQPLPISIPGVPGLPQNGEIPEKDFLRWMIGLDKNLWIRPLNKTQTFLVSMQYFGQWVPDYDGRMRQGVPLYPNPTEFPAVREVEGTFTLLTNTIYLSGRVTPQMVVAYDVRGAWLLQPSVNLLREPFRFMIQYSAIVGNFTGFGVFRDRDQISFIFSYLLN